MPDRFVAILTWQQCNPVTPDLVGRWSFYSDVTPTGTWFEWDNRDQPTLVDGPKYDAEVKRRAGEPLTEREAERYP